MERKCRKQNIQMTRGIGVEVIVGRGDGLLKMKTAFKIHNETYYLVTQYKNHKRVQMQDTL